MSRNEEQWMKWFAGIAIAAGLLLATMITVLTRVCPRFRREKGGRVFR